MGQMVMVDEEQLRRLESSQRILDEYVFASNTILYSGYPDVKYWVDAGNIYTVHLMMLNKAAKDIEKHRKKTIKKFRRNGKFRKEDKR